MELLKPEIKDYPGRHIEFKIDNPNLDFAEAKDNEARSPVACQIGSSFDPGFFIQTVCNTRISARKLYC
jgi:hypothetical protein